MTNYLARGVAAAVSLFATARVAAAEGPAYWVCVSNERSGDVTVIDGDEAHRGRDDRRSGSGRAGSTPAPTASPLYVALSGSPIGGPPQLDAKGNPILHKEGDDDDDKNADHAADGIGVVDLALQKFLRKLPAGSDPEQFAVSADGTRLYVANEDVGTASVMSVADGKVEHIVPVKKEPEGVGITPDGKFVYVTCETGGEVFVIDAKTNKAVAPDRRRRPAAERGVPAGRVAGRSSRRSPPGCCTSSTPPATRRSRRSTCPPARGRWGRPWRPTAKCSTSAPAAAGRSCVVDTATDDVAGHDPGRRPARGAWPSPPTARPCTSPTARRTTCRWSI